MRFPENLKYTKDHEWTRLEGKMAVVGITDHAQSSLGDVVYLELPEVGRVVKQGETFGVVESIKAVSDLYAPVSGKVVAVNSKLTNDPSQINQDPHGEAWMVKIEMNDTSGPALMDAVAYTKFVESIK